MKREDVRVKTTDNWCPNYDNDEVELSLVKLQGEPITYRVCVWGADDLGLERDYVSDDVSEARSMFDYVKSLPLVNISTLITLGFDYF